MDLGSVQQRVGMVESMLSGGVGRATERKKVLCTHELDRLAESLVGEPAAEAQEVKNHIQQLLAQIVPQRQEVLDYIEVYCQGSRRSP